MNEKKKTLTMEFIESIMDENYTLVWVDYRESFDENRDLLQQCLEKQGCEDLWSKVEDWYEDAEEQGLLLRLPCKVGDKLYRITPYAKEPIITTHVLQINIKQFFNEKIIVRIDVMDKMGESCYFLDDIGKKAFLSRAEAEAKLAEMEGAE